MTRNRNRIWISWQKARGLLGQSWKYEQCKQGFMFPVYSWDDSRWYRVGCVQGDWYMEDDA